MFDNIGITIIAIAATYWMASLVLKESIAFMRAVVDVKSEVSTAYIFSFLFGAILGTAGALVQRMGGLGLVLMLSTACSAMYLTAFGQFVYWSEKTDQTEAAQFAYWWSVRRGTTANPTLS